MGAGSTAKRRRTGTDSSANSVTPSRVKSGGTGRGRGRPPNVPRDGRERPPPLAECFHKRCSDVLDRLSKKDHYNIFLEPVNTDDVVGYADIIKRPMDFTTMRTRLARQEYKSLGEFRKDLDLIWSNCLLFNGKEPTNIFSKKAIELRRLTEKLIVTTRQYLEKDKENLIKWKEKHRRRRETMQANAANAKAALHGSSAVMSSSLMHGSNRPLASAGSRDPMDTSANEVSGGEQNGRTPEENALAEYMRLQYSGTTGLFRKGMLHSPLPQYTRPDGSVVQIPIRRYHPEGDNWQLESPSGLLGVRYAQSPTLSSDSLPSRKQPNPCQPRLNMESLLVSEYAESLYEFVRNAGPTANEIVTELLSPELAIKKQQEELLKQGLSLKELAEKAKAAALKAKQAAASQVRNRWDTDAICKLADDIERSNRKIVSMLPKLSRSIKELDGITGLAHFLDSKLLKEVDEVPVQVVDYAMPHGASLATISEIFRLQNVSAVQIPPHDLQSLELLRKSAQDFVSQMGPESTVKMSGASALTSEQLHEVQMRARMMRQQRRREAQRQAGIIAEKAGIASGGRTEATSTLSRRGTEHTIPNSETSGVTQVRSVGLPQYRVVHRQRSAETVPRANVTGPELAMGTHVANTIVQDKGGRGHQALVGTQTHPMASALPPADKNAVCKNCGTRDTLGWRAGNVGPDGVERLCIACGLYWQKTNRHRPKELWAQNLQRQPRVPSASAVPNGMIAAHGIIAPQHNPNLMGTPNGVAKRPIQKIVKGAQPAPKRLSPSGLAPAKVLKSRVVVGGPSFVQGSNPVQTGAAQNAYGASGLHPATAPVQNPGPGFQAQMTDMDARSALAAQALHPNAPTQLRNSIGSYSTPPVMYSNHQPISTGSSSQHIVPATAQGHSAELVALQKQQLLQQNALRQQLGVQQIGISHPMTFMSQPQQGRNPQVIANTNGNMGQKAAPNVQLTTVSQAESAKEPDSKGQDDAQGDKDKRRNQEIPSDTNVNGIGSVGLESLEEPNNNNIVGGFGDDLGRGGFGNGPSIGSSAIGSDQIEDIFFADGAMEASAGSPAFDF